MAIYQWGSGPCGCIDTQGLLSLPEGGALAIEPDPAESGDIRLPNGGSIKARSAADTADVLAVLVNAEDEVRLGSEPGAEVVLSADGKLRADGSTTLSWDAALVAPQVPLAVNAGAGSVAETGDLRLRSDFTIKARNAGNGADHILMRQDGSNNVYVGGAAPGVYLDAVGGSRFGALPTSVRSFVPRFEFFATVTAPLIHQIADATASATGEPLTVQAQDCTGTTSTGGALVLRSGDGTTSDGEIRVSKGTTMSVLATSGTDLVVGGSIAAATPPTDVSLDGASSATLKVDGAARLTAEAATVTAVPPLAVNTGAAGLSGVATSGDVRLRNAFSMTARNAAGDADHGIVGQDSSNRVHVGGDGPEIRLHADGAARLSVRPSSLLAEVPTLEFADDVASPVVRQAGDSAASASGDTLTVHAQDCTGTSSTGGALRLRSGDGLSSDGEVLVSKGTTMSVVTSSGTEVVVGGDAIGSRPSVVALDGSAASALRVDGAPKVLAEPSLVASSSPLAINTAAGNVAAAGDLRLRNTAAVTARNGSGNADIRIAMVAADDAVVLGHGDGTGAFLTLRSDGTSTLGAGSAEPIVVAPSLTSFDRDVAIGSGRVASSGAVRLANNTAVTARKAGTGDVKLIALDDSDEVILGDTWARLGASHLQSEVKELRWARTITDPTISQESDNTASAVGETLTVVAQECVGADGIGGNLHLRPGRGETHGELHLQDGVGNQRLTINPTGDVTINADSTFLLLRDSAEVVRVEDSVALAGVPIKSTVASGARSLLWTMTPTSPATNDHVVRLYRHQLGLEVTVNAAWSGSQWEKDTATRASRLRFENDRLLLHFHNTTTQTFSDAAWTGSFSQLPNTGANASITNAAELQGPGQTEAYVGQQCPRASAGTNTNVGSGCTFRKRFPATPSSVTITNLVSSGISGSPNAYQTTAYGTGAWAATTASAGVTVYFYARVVAS